MAKKETFDQMVDRNKKALSKSKAIKGDLSLLGSVTHVNGKPVKRGTSDGYMATKAKAVKPSKGMM